MLLGTIEVYTTHTDGKQRFAGVHVSGVPGKIKLYGDETEVELQPAVGQLEDEDADYDND